MDDKKNRVLTIIAFSVLAIMLIGGSYAFFAPQAGGTTSTNATVTSNTTDLLTFSINRDISFTVTQNDFQENGTNKSGDATASATLTPNNKTGAATMNYYLYLNIESNPTVYSETNTNEVPELMLQVFDGSNQLVTLTGLGTQKTIKGVTGYDITGVTGLKTLLDNHAISASNNTATIENWRIVITLINHDFNQNDNTGKTIEAEIIIQQEELSLGFTGTGTIYRNSIQYALNNHTIEDEIINVWCYDDNGVPSCTSLYTTQSSCENLGHTCSLAPITLGVGSYETDISLMGTKTYDVYCPIGGDNLICGNNWYYPTEQDCISDVDTSTYTCTPGTITKPIFLKHSVVNNVIQSTEVCFFYNNHEFCMGPNYYDTDFATTRSKLISDINNTLGIELTNDDCDGRNDIYAECQVNGVWFTTFSDGDTIFNAPNDSCIIDSNGFSKCG